MANESKLEQIRSLIARVEKNLQDIESLDMAGLAPWWPTLSEKALAINEDLRVLIPLAAEVHPVMVKEIRLLKEQVVNMRIDCYNRLGDVTAGERKDPELCGSMKAHSYQDHYSQHAQDFCISECPHQDRCLATEPGDNFLGGEL